MLKLWFVVISFVASVTNAAVLVSEYGQKRIIELRGTTQACILHTDRDMIKKLIANNGPSFLPNLSSKDFDTFYASCRDTDQLNQRGGFIFPGTYWCGPGNIAHSFSDLGPLVEEDKCCREHDHCPNQLEPGQCRQGVCNTSPFTRSHCDCDKAFKRCLRQVNTSFGNIIGLLYFNIVQVTCFNDRRLCPMRMRKCRKMQFHEMAPFMSARKSFYRDKSALVSNIVNDLLRQFLSFGFQK